MSIEAVLMVALNQLRSVNDGPTRCRETSLAITSVEDALLRLNHRTRERIARGVEGTSQA